MQTEFKTRNNKTISLYNEGNMVRAKFFEGGKLPDCLGGCWTNMTSASLAVYIYLNDKEPVYTEDHTENGTPIKVKNPNKNPTETEE